MKQKKSINGENQMKLSGMCLARDMRRKEFRLMKYFGEKNLRE
jgi:hypothetical protein